MSMTEVRHLDHRPSLIRLYGKAAVTSLSTGGGLPDRRVELAGVAVDRGELAAYDRVCGFRLRDRLPLTYPHVLGFPLQIELMAAGDFPFALPGLVHIRNVVTQSRPLTVDDYLTVAVTARDERPHPKGRQLDLVTEVAVGDDVVWDGTSTYLRRGGHGGDPEQPRDAPGGPEVEAPDARWHVPADTGRRYGAVSGDRNPIHMSALSARLFGFPRAIAHGMWTAARSLAALEDVTPDAATADVQFRAPLLLPADVAFESDVAGGVRRFAVRQAGGDRLHLVGSLTEA